MEDTPLSVMLEEFKKGHYHLAIVQRINAEGEGDPVYEAVGLITLEDIIEEIIQAEIRDEFDIIRDSRQRRLRNMRRGTLMTASGAGTTDVSIFFNQNIDICDVSPQLTLATYQYLSTTLDAFRTSLISESVLHRLIRQNVVRTKLPEAYENVKYIYQKGKDSDFFVLILEGKCTVTVGESNMLFEAGPFHYFGYELLTKITTDLYRRGSVMSLGPPPTARNGSISMGSSPLAPGSAGVPVESSRKKYTFTPDFHLQIGQQDLIYLKITASVYMKAYRATLIERGRGGGGGGAGGLMSKDNPTTTSESGSVLNSPEGGGATVQNSAAMQLHNYVSGGSIGVVGGESAGGSVQQNRSRSLSDECKSLIISKAIKVANADANSLCSDSAVIKEESDGT